MLISMTVFACGVRDGIGHFARRVALYTIRANVFSSKRKAGFVVIKILGHLRNGKALCRMTAAAVRSELAFMSIFVTSIAGREVQTLID